MRPYSEPGAARIYGIGFLTDFMTSIYLHIPFCESKCVYCDFNSYAGLDHLFADFVDALCADIARGPEYATLARLAPASTTDDGRWTIAEGSESQIGRASCRERVEIAVVGV